MRNLHSAMLALAAALTAESALAEQCRLAPPRLSEQGGTYRLRTELICGNAGRSAVNYPSGTVYVGATLYRFDSQLKNLTVLVEGTTQAPFLDLPAISVASPPAQRELNWPIGSNRDFTHALIVVWDQKNDCGSGDQSPSRCPTSGYTLGRVDPNFEMPIPVDAFPRPICDRKELERAGFFDWVSDSGDPSGKSTAVTPDRRRQMNLNDCWSLVDDGIGLGFSVRRWRAAPVQAN